MPESTVVKLYVSNIPYLWDEADLKELFKQVGTVTENRIIRDRETKRSKGYGFVTVDCYPNPPDFWRQLQGVEVMGRTLTVDVARKEAAKD